MIDTTPLQTMDAVPRWLELSLDCDKAEVDAAEETLLTAGAVSVTLGDAADQPLLEPGPGETPIWESVVVTALFDIADGELEAVTKKTVEQVREAISQHSLPAAVATSLRWGILADQVWERTWMDHFSAMQFGKRLWVVPSWDDTARPDATQLRLDPGLAFGTGTHPTTAMCLGFVDRFFTDSAYAQARGSEIRAIDFGCGSGILGIAAILLGAHQVEAVDIDPQALTATIENARLNGVEDRLSCVDASALKPRSAGLVMANILAGPLVELAGTLSNLTAANGYLLLSGILTDQADRVRKAYRLHGFELDLIGIDDWCCLHGCRTTG